MSANAVVSHVRPSHSPTIVTPVLVLLSLPLYWHLLHVIGIFPPMIGSITLTNTYGS
jgi:uncharacterized membrane protein YvlD (DUF360 family)